MGELPPKVLKAVQTALQRARGWRRPPHWDCHQWQEELDAIAQASAFEACFRFDEQQGVPLEAFIFQQVLIALRDFHRREWAYFAICCGHLQRAHDAGEREEVEESMKVCGQVEMEQMEREWRRCFVLWSMRQLSERERQVIRRLYWDEWTETEIAQEMEISQPMISKIKQQALRKLKDLLSGLL
jgi:RNA polymerase sigma factor (sigma-70 family)